jgi:segregation and condensation protein A
VSDDDTLLALPAPEPAEAVAGPAVVDHVAVARLYGEPLFTLPTDLYIPPDALEVFLEAFEGPLDLLLKPVLPNRLKAMIALQLGLR